MVDVVDFWVRRIRVTEVSEQDAKGESAPPGVFGGIFREEKCFPVRLDKPCLEAQNFSGRIKSEYASGLLPDVP
jgi:hypothetical protein